MNSIIRRQHSMILNYDLFLTSNDTRDKALQLFTNKRFLQCFLNVIRLLDISIHEKVCLNKLAYDYYLLEDKDPVVSDMLYRLTTEVNGKEIVVLSGIIGLKNAQILSMIKHSTFKEDKSVQRVNKFLVKCGLDLSVQNMIDIFLHLYDRFTPVFCYTMLIGRPSIMTVQEKTKFDNISIAMLDILNSVSSDDIRKVLNNYAYLLNTPGTRRVRFSMHGLAAYPRISAVINSIEIQGPYDII